MKEESHLEEMRAALRGERERAEQARRRSSENVLAALEPRVPEPVAPPEERQGLLARLLGR